MKYFIKTFGCQMNFSDSERMAAFFEENNLKPAEKIEEADLIVFNTCGVRQTAEDRVYGQVHNLKKHPNNPSHRRERIYAFPTNGDKHFIVITGCLSHRKDVQKKLKEKVDLFLPIADFPKMFELLKVRLLARQKSDFVQQQRDNNVAMKQCNNLPSHYLCIQPKYEKKDSAFVPIMTGCNNFCAYCVVPYARGREWSRPFEEIVQEIETLSKNGCEEITLLGQNVNSYEFRIINNESRVMKNKDNLTMKQFNNKTITFPILLEFLSTSHPGIKFKFLTSHPKDYSDELIEVIAENENISREIHLPVQAGSDKILKAMNRPYSQKHYLNLIEKTKKRIPNVKFSTDVIVGFPGETENDFEETVKVFKKVQYFEAYVNKYSPRPGTAAFKLENNISWEEKKQREKILKKLLDC